MSKQFKIAVIGAGVVGLSTAVNLQNTLGSKCHVTIIADKFFDETTSYGAAGIFKPSLQRIPGVSEESLRKWTNDGWNHYSSLATSPEADDAGVFMTSGYMYFNDAKPRPLFADYVYEFHECNEKELAIYQGQRYRYGWHLTSVLVECRKYLPFLMKRFKQKGGRVIKRRIETFDEVARHYDLIVNCSGLGSRKLSRDDQMYQIRGHLIRVKAPWMKRFVHADNLYFAYPVRDSVVLGGIMEVHGTEATPRKEDRDLILRRVHELLPSLKEAEILEEWVGFRPSRAKIRIECEKKMTKDLTKPVWIVHNYGHGGSGVALSWGTAISVCELVRDVLSSDLKSRL